VSLGVTVICNNCGTILGSAPYGAAAKALEDARDAGATTDLPGGRDLCRACAALVDRIQAETNYLIHTRFTPR
jgi:hypothetical protein